MRNKQVDDWVSENMVLSDNDKRQCVGIAQQLVEITIDVQRNGLLSIEDKLLQIKDTFLQKALSLAFDGAMSPYELRETLQHDFMADYAACKKEAAQPSHIYNVTNTQIKNRELFTRLLITEGVTEIAKGANAMQIAVYLASFFGENYFHITDAR